MKSKAYKNYLKSSKWIQTRIDVLLSRKSCERCGSTHKLQVHHKNYDNLGNEEPEDLELLCNNCHCKEHGKEILIQTPDKKLTKKQQKRKRLLVKQKTEINNSRRTQAYFDKYGGYGL